MFRSICRQVTVSSLEISDMLATISDTLNTIHTTRLEDKKPAESGMLDRIWRTTLKIPDSPKRSMLRSASSSGRKKSRSRSASLESRTSDINQADEYSEMIVQAVKVVMSKLFKELELPDHTAGEMLLSRGRLSGMWKVNRVDGESQIDCDANWNTNTLALSLVVRGLLSSYNFRSATIITGIICYNATLKLTCRNQSHLVITETNV